VLKKEAERITGGLSAPGKMPEGSYNLPASMCQTGAILREIPETPCHKCYAFKGRYNFPNVKDALARRLKSLTHPQWVEAMTTLVKKASWTPGHESATVKHAPWPLDHSSWISDPGISFREHGPRVRAKINVCLGWAICHEIWCGENLSLFPRVTFNSTVKKCLLLLYPNRSGMPSKLRFSIRFQTMEGVFFLRSWYNFRSDVSAFFKVTTAC
jgi:hypothetical protein